MFLAPEILDTHSIEDKDQENSPHVQTGKEIDIFIDDNIDIRRDFNKNNKSKV